MEYRKIKIRVGTSESSEQIQKLLMEQGCRWAVGGGVQCTYRPFLYVDKDGVFTVSGKTGEQSPHDVEFFNSHEHKEVRVVSTTVYSLELTREIITLNGKKYYKDEVDSYLQYMEEIT